MLLQALAGPPLGARRTSRRTPPAARSGDGPVGAWLDLASLVSSGSRAPGLGEFVSAVGKECYLDVSGWHLLLKDAKLDLAVCNGLSALVTKNQPVSEEQVRGLLKRIPVKLGGGKLTVSLEELMPSRCVADLVDLTERFARD